MISLIVAIAKNNVIGGDNKLLWHLSEDLKRFKSITLNHTLVMGRKTFESLPGILPNRKHIVITRDNNYTVDSEMVTVIHSLDDLVNKYSNCDEEVFVIGGGEIYTLLLPHVNKLYLTHIKEDFVGDTVFPTIDYNDWTIVSESKNHYDEKSNIYFDFIDYCRKSK